MTGPETTGTSQTAASAVAAQVRDWRAASVRAMFARVIDMQGFSSWSASELVAVSETGEQVGDILGQYGAQRLAAAAGTALSGGTAGWSRLVLEVDDADAAAAGLACGGRAELLQQPTDTVPDQLWSALADRNPVALLTRLDEPTAHPAGVVVTGDGDSYGGSASQDLVAAAVAALDRGQSSTERIDDPAGPVLLQAWVPPVRLVVVGAGELVATIAAQGQLLGWQTRATEDLAQLDTDLTWAGGSAALVVLSHDPDVDAPALTAGLAAGVGYVGAMGSRRTQARRIEHLNTSGVHQAAIDRIHRPIGLDLGGRGASEMALSICAEILAARRGRDARPLAERGGPINDRPAVSA